MAGCFFAVVAGWLVVVANWLMYGGCSCWLLFVVYVVFEVGCCC